MKISTSVNIGFTEKDVKQLILDKIAEYDNRIVVTDIDFIQRRKPSGLEVTVEAHMGDGVVVNEVPESAKALADTAEEDQGELDLETEAEEAVEEETTVLEEEATEEESIEDIFNSAD